MDEFFGRLADLVGYQAIYPLTMLLIAWAVYTIKKNRPRWKTLDFGDKANVVLVVWVAFTALVASIAVYIGTHRG